MNAKTILPLLVLALAAACGPKPSAPPPDQLAPEFVGGGQPGADGGVAYPGPYGVGVGSVIPNFQFLGFPRASTDAIHLVPVQFADYYNPTGTGVYPAGSPYDEGRILPLAVVIDRSAVWCNPCNLEAANVLPGKHAQYAPGGEFLVALDDGPNPGVAAEQLDLYGWASRYHLDYPAVLNPNQALSAIVGVDAYPGHIIVRTKDMKIVTWIAGEPDAAFWQLYENTLDGMPVLPGD